MNNKEIDFFVAVTEALTTIWEFALKHKNAVPDSDFWTEFNAQIDMQFSVCDDEQCADYGKMEYFIYPLVTLPEGQTTPDTSCGAQITSRTLAGFTSEHDFTLEQFRDGRWFYKFGNIRSKARYATAQLAFHALQQQISKNH